MILKKEILFGDFNFHEKFNFDYKNKTISDALIKEIGSSIGSVEKYRISDSAISLKIEGIAKVLYLDARTLDELTLEIKVLENVEFSSDKIQAEELDIDYIEEELDLEELIFELIITQIPFNYSENENTLIKKEGDFDTDNKPFENLFN